MHNTLYADSSSLSNIMSCVTQPIKNDIERTRNVVLRYFISERQNTPLFLINVTMIYEEAAQGVVLHNKGHVLGFKVSGSYLWLFVTEQSTRLKTIFFNLNKFDVPSNCLWRSPDCTRFLYSGLKWPPRRPDLHLIDYVWDGLRRMIRWNCGVTNSGTLWRGLLISIGTDSTERGWYCDTNYGINAESCQLQ